MSERMTRTLMTTFASLRFALYKLEPYLYQGFEEMSYVRYAPYFPYAWKNNANIW